MITIPRHTGDLLDGVPGPWWLPVVENGQAVSANIKCPNGHTAGISTHAIGADGTVQPSVVCGGDDCGWHEFIKLEGW